MIIQSTTVTDTAQNNPHGIDPQDADLVLSSLRHQRDLFSGPLGIPDVTTRVGSVIHAFETMARQRQTLGTGGSHRADKPYDTSKYRSHRSNVKRIGDSNRHKIILPSPKISPSSSAEAGGQFYPGQQFQHLHPLEVSQNPSHPYQQSMSSRQYHPDHRQQQQHHHHLPPTSFSYTDPHGVPPSVRRHTSGGGGGSGGVPGEENIHINNNNFEQNLPHSVNDHNHHSQTLPRVALLPASLSASGTNTIAGDGTELPPFQLNNENESSNFDSLNLDDDYRKSSFGKQSNLLYQQQQQQQQQQQNQQLFQRRNQPSNINTLLLARAQQPNGGSAGHRGAAARGLWSLFGGNPSKPSATIDHHSSATPVYSSSRNNPNVFFNANAAPTDRGTGAEAPSATTLPMSTATASNSTGTMRYYNHDNTGNSANRRTAPTEYDGREEDGHGVTTVPHAADAPDGQAYRYRNEADTGLANEGDNEALDNHVSGDKFLRGSTVSQSFIKNVRIIGKKSSSYDVSGASSANNHAPLRKDGKGRNEPVARSGAGTAADTAGTSSSSNGFKQRGSLMMAAAAKHFTKRNRAPQPVAKPASETVAPDTDELTGTLRPKPPEDAPDSLADDTAAANEPGSAKRPGQHASLVKARGAPAGTAGKQRLLLFQPRTIDRAEI
uniref:Uncharacterized protein n=1 Tax=Anopheles epiroticus TaxID=199890 RepID=A0A182PB98_9DIPT